MHSTNRFIHIIINIYSLIYIYVHEHMLSYKFLVKRTYQFMTYTSYRDYNLIKPVVQGHMLFKKYPVKKIGNRQHIIRAYLIGLQSHQKRTVGWSSRRQPCNKINKPKVASAAGENYGYM